MDRQRWVEIEHKESVMLIRTAREEGKYKGREEKKRRRERHERARRQDRRRKERRKGDKKKMNVNHSHG